MSLLNSTRLATAIAVVAAPVFAHPGHVAETSGHTHWFALGAVGVAAVVAIWAIRKSKKTKTIESVEKADSSDHDDLQEA